MYRKTNHLMKKLHIFLLAALACGNAWAEGNNTFYFTDAIARPGETTNIELCMKNTMPNLTCLEAEIQLPEGLSVVCDGEGNPICTLYLNRTKEHEILTNVLENGNFKFLVSSVDSKLITDGDGPLLSFCVKVSETAQTGECTVETVGESLLVNTAAEAIYSVGVTGNIFITDDPTDLKDLNDFKDLNDAIYNLAGQRLSKKQKGINIVGGKKTITK